MRNQRGVTLIELLMTMVIGVIAIMAMAIPFVAERSFWATGRAQTEAQRDAQFVLRAIARTVRESTGYNAGTGEFDFPCGTRIFKTAGESGENLEVEDGCDGVTATLISGRSRVTAFDISELEDNLVRIQLEVMHNDREDEFLETEIFLRNAS